MQRSATRELSWPYPNNADIRGHALLTRSDDTVFAGDLASPCRYLHQTEMNMFFPDLLNMTQAPAWMPDNVWCGCCQASSHANRNFRPPEKHPVPT